MQKKERNVILVGVGIVIAIILIVVLVRGMNKKGDTQKNVQNTQAEQNVEKYTTNLEDGTKINNSDEFNTSKKYKEIEITNIQFTYQNGRSVLLAQARNTSSSKHAGEIVKISILGEGNKVLDEINAIIPTMEAGETKQLNITISGADSVNVKDFKIEEKK